ncbi:MAG: hypothetical protein R3E68_10760 [Burkholderiaceae bacterium]
MSARRDKNLIACLHFRPELGGEKVFVLDVKETGESRSQDLVANLKVPYLFGPDFHYGTWEQAIEAGGEIRSTRMTDEFGFTDFRDSLPGEFVPLVGIDPKGRLVPFTDAGRPTIRPGWTLLSLVPAETLALEQKARQEDPEGGKRGSKSNGRKKAAAAEEAAAAGAAADEAAARRAADPSAGSGTDAPAAPAG